MTEQKINTLLELYQTGRYVEAEKLSLSITKDFPQHQLAWKVLALVLKQNGKISESLIAIQKSIQLEPRDSNAHYNLGVILLELRRLDEAEVSFRQTIELKPDYTEAHNNLSFILQKLKRLDEAENSYRKLIELKPDYAEAHNNLGVTLKELGKFEESEACYKKAIIIKPDYAEAHRNLGITLVDMGRLEEAMSNYTKAIELNPHLPKSLQGLAGLLTIYAPHDGFLHPVANVNKEIKKKYLKEKTIGIISDDKIIKLFNQSTSVIKKYNLKIETQSCQAFRQNSINLNCERHMKIFNKFNIIPKFCFGCYKVQVEPRTILELIKLLLVLDQIKLIENNIRKCMVEMRPEISGFYKGLIFCSSLEEAYQIAHYLEKFLEENIRSGLHAVVKRGCSEYPISFPDYEKINYSGPQLMNYKEEWKVIENDYDKKQSIYYSKSTLTSLMGLNLSDVLIIRKWVDYAKGIGDPSVDLLNQNTVYHQDIYDLAKARLDSLNVTTL